MSIDEHGFLGKEIEGYKQNIENKFKDIFELAYELNEYAQKIKFKFIIHNKDGQEVIAASLFIRILNGFQGAVILLKYGLTIESVVIVRSTLETLFVLKRICDDREYVRDYVKSDEKKRLKLMNIAHRNPSALFESLRQYATEEIITELKSKITKENIDEIQLETLAVKAGMRDYYDGVYRILSGISHPTPRAIEKYAVVDENRDVKSFNCGPMEDNLSETLITVIGLLNLALESVLKLFKLNEEEKLTYFEEKERITINKYLNK
ncbi:MAG: DUF5677 domain-containing protein [Elusimicrobiota bacterium]